MKMSSYSRGHWSNLGFFWSLGNSHLKIRKQVSLYFKLYASHLVIRSFCVFGECWNDRKEISIGIEQHYGSHLVFLVTFFKKFFHDWPIGLIYVYLFRYYMLLESIGSILFVYHNNNVQILSRIQLLLLICQSCSKNCSFVVQHVSWFWSFSPHL